jgi:TolB-like protein
MGCLLEFPSVVAAVECAVAIQNLMAERNADVPELKRVVYRIGVNLGDILIEGDDILGEGVNIAARLEGICEPGGVLISSTAYDHVRGKIDAEFVDLGEKPLKNIARPMRVYALNTGSESAAPAPSATEPNRPGPPRLSIVVLPFAIIGGDPEQNYFVDGVTESLTTDLSRIRGSFVIARNTAFTYKGKSFDVKQVGRDLNVRYVLEGSVQRGGNRMRVNVQLIDAESGGHLWAERFDKPLADLFDMQDEIVARLANALGTQLVTAEARRAERAPTPDSMDLYFHGRAWVNKGMNRDNFLEARVLFERALKLDPANVDALVLIAIVDALSVANLQSENQAERLAAAEDAAIKALSLAPDHPLGHACMGVVQIFTNRVVQGIAECERALELDRNLPYAHGIIAGAMVYLGRFEEAEDHVREALRLSPRDPFVYHWDNIAGVANFYLGKEEQAISWLRRSIEANRTFPPPHFYLAAVLACLGRLPEARAEVRAGLVADPKFTIARFRAGTLPGHLAYLAGRERLIDGMRKAGVPEG